MEAYRSLGITLFHLGEFGAAHAHLEQSLALYDAQRDHSHFFLYSILEPGVFSLSFAALVLWHLGYPDQALQKSMAARALGQERSYPYSLGGARLYAAVSHQLRRERPLTQEWAEAVINLAHEHGFPVWFGKGTVLQGWALAERGQREEGIRQIGQGLATQQAVGAGFFRSYYLVLLAEACGKAGQAEQGLTVLSEALETVHRMGERFYEAELYRLKGELLLAQENQKAKIETDPRPLNPEPQGEAEACFLKAIAVAQKQQAKSLELRAVMSLVRLRQQQAAQSDSRDTNHGAQTKLDEAHKMLSEIYSWFTEGFDTKDLQEAKALLEELNP
jgi:predicted ATPase